MTFFVHRSKRPGYWNNSQCARRWNEWWSRIKAAGWAIGKTLALMFKVDDCKKTCDELKSKSVMIIMEPRKAPLGLQARIVDLYGNPVWLIEHPKWKKSYNKLSYFCIWLAVYRKFCKFGVKFLNTVCYFVLFMWNFLPNNFFRFMILQKNWHTAPSNWEIHRFFIAKTMYRKKSVKVSIFLD